MKKRMISILLVLGMLAALTACGKKEPEVLVTAPETEARFLTACVLYDGKIDGDDYNVNCQTGAVNAQNRLGVAVTNVECDDKDAMKTELENAAKDKYDLIVCTSDSFKDALETAAKNYPDKCFAIIGADGSGDNIMGLKVSDKAENVTETELTYDAVRTIVNVTYKGGDTMEVENKD